MASIAKLIARHLIFPAAVKTGANKFLINRSNHSILILNYHGVVSEADFGISVNHMSVADFDKQIRYFSNNFNILSLDDFIKISNGELDVPDRKSILITFDDGYENNFTHAYPVLKKHKAPAVIFPVMGLTGSSMPSWYDAIDITKYKLTDANKTAKLSSLAKEFGLTFRSMEYLHELTEGMKNLTPTQKHEFIEKYLDITGREFQQDTSKFQYWKMLNESQIKQMSDDGLVAFGSHTVSHPNLDRIPIETAIQEIQQSKNKLETITGKPVKSIAFPDGGYNDEIKKHVIESGYEVMFSVTPKCQSDQSDKTIFRRFSVPNTTTTDSVIFNASLAFKTQGVL
ncbi:MAG: polysaccharide deacetylase family protein [Bacteroidota bacterium]